MSNLLEGFANRLAMSKALRFELKPIGKAAKNIEKAEIIRSMWSDGKNKIET